MLEKKHRRGVAYARVDNREHSLDFGRSTSLWGLIWQWLRGVALALDTL